MRALCLTLVACGSTATPTTTAPKPAAPAPAPARSAAPMLTTVPAPTDETTRFSLSKFAAEIGSESDTYTAIPGGGIEAKAVFSFRDRTSTVPLAAAIGFDREGHMYGYRAWGSTSRGSSIDDAVVPTADGGFDVTRLKQPLRHVVPTGVAVVASTYAPMLTQELAIRAWLQHGRPAKLALLPEGELAIEARGRASYDNAGTAITLEHLAITGLVWGREDAWIDDTGRLVAVITRDDEFDHFEAMREGFRGLMPALLKQGAADGTAWLGANAKTALRATGPTVAFVGGRLIDGTNRPAIDNAVVVVTGDKIVAAGPRDKVAIPAGATSIDITGKSILPGLWDMHAHVEQVEQLAVYLSAGVTTVRDMGNIFEFILSVRDSIDAGTGLGPRVIASCIVDGAGEGLGAQRIKSRADIVPMIDKFAAAHCAEVKIYSFIAPELVKPIIEYAHKRGLRAVGHIPEGMTVREAIDAGYDSISHIHFLFDIMIPKDVAKQLSYLERSKRLAAYDLGSAAMTQQIDALVAHKVAIDDTIALGEWFWFPLAEREKREPGIATLPRELRAGLGDISKAQAPVLAGVYAKAVELLRLLHKRGVPIVAGTDISVPGHSVHRELEIYVDAGFTNLEAIQAATIVPARLLKRDKELGTVEPGKVADLVIVDGNPLANIHDIRNVALVVARGKVYDTAPLWRLAGFKTLR